MIDDIFEEARVSLMVMPEDGATTQEEIIIEQLNYGLLDLEESKDLYDDDKDFFKHLLSSGEWSIEDLCVYVDFKDPNLLDIIKNIVLDAYKSSSDLEVLYCLPSKLQHDKKVVLTAVSSSPWELEAVPRAFKDDKEVVMAAVSVDGRTLEFASTRLKNNKEVVMAAILKGWGFRNVSNRLQYDKEVYLPVLLEDPYRSHVYPPCNLVKLDLKTLPSNHRSIIYNDYLRRSGEEDVFLLAKAKKHFLT